MEVAPPLVGPVSAPLFRVLSSAGVGGSGWLEPQHSEPLLHVAESSFQEHHAGIESADSNFDGTKPFIQPVDAVYEARLHPIHAICKAGFQP